MGFMGKQRAQDDDAPVPVVEGCPDAGAHYVTKLLLSGSMTQGMFDQTLNEQYGRGYRFAFAYQSDGKTTVAVFEHNHP